MGDAVDVVGTRFEGSGDYDVGHLSGLTQAGIVAAADKDGIKSLVLRTKYSFNDGCGRNGDRFRKQ